MLPDLLSSLALSLSLLLLSLCPPPTSTSSLCLLLLTLLSLSLQSYLVFSLPPALKLSRRLRLGRVFLEGVVLVLLGL